ncbi:MAG: precorrin-6A synthase (deacetylating) [Rhodobacteraceae bacterium]|jgi:precorrin-6A synthase|nr:precorrin-6A synthase (deacetylating) [Paracoccaceae bacterium]
MIELLLIGIGTGNPDHITRQAEKAIASADWIMIPTKGDNKADLADLRHDICAQIAGVDLSRILEFELPVRDPAIPYVDRVHHWHDAIADVWQETIQVNIKTGKVALLIWGDPSLYDSSLRIASRLNPAPKITVLPGLTSLQVLTAAHAIPINELAHPFVVTTGRQLRDNGWPTGMDTVAVMLDGECSFQSLENQNCQIYWGAYVGMKEEILIQGPLDQVTEQIVEMRAKARENHGWIMDIYVLKLLS